MALLKSITFDGGFVAGYHRIGVVLVGAPGEASTITVESFVSRQAREHPGSEFRRSEYDAIISGTNPVTDGYNALVAHADFTGAVSDDDNFVATPADIPAVRSGLYRWDGTTWVLLIQPTPLAQLRERAYLLVDGAAGQARLRYITSVPGQAETYTRKETQARTWAAAGFTGPAPSFIAAEAAVLGVTPQSVAENVIALADSWENGKGPEIEAARIGGKAAITAATDAAGIESAMQAAIDELDSL